ncbi:oxidoreductase [Streptomyces avidinii]
MSPETQQWTPIHGQPYRPAPYRPERMPQQESLARAAELRTRMDERRTVRHFSPDPVPDQVVRDAIACAATAPSGAHQQPWTFVLVKNPRRGRRRRAAGRRRHRWTCR